MKNNPLYQVLVERYGVSMLKPEVAEVLRCSLSSLSSKMKNGYGHPNYKKSGHSKNSKVIFPTHEVVEFLNQTTKSL